MYIIHREISPKPITELENDSESVWIKTFTNKSCHCVASWYRQPNGTVEDLVVSRSA